MQVWLAILLLLTAPAFSKVKAKAKKADACEVAKAKCEAAKAKGAAAKKATSKKAADKKAADKKAADKKAADKKAADDQKAADKKAADEKNITVHTNFTLTLLHKRGQGSIESDITIESRDACSGQDLGTSSGNGDPARVAFTADLNSASLTGEIAVIDAGGNVRSVPVSLAWTGVGTIKRANTMSRIVTGNVTTAIQTRNASRSASVTGSVDGLPVDSTNGMLFKDATIIRTH